MFEALKKKLEKTKNQVVELVKVSEEIRSQRFEICKNCDQLRSAEFCKLCGCYMPAKTWLSGASCPLKKWVAIP
jgi:recombinational DNA repair protein RecR